MKAEETHGKQEDSIWSNCSDATASQGYDSISHAAAACDSAGWCDYHRFYLRKKKNVRKVTITPFCKPLHKSIQSRAFLNLFRRQMSAILREQNLLCEEY